MKSNLKLELKYDKNLFDVLKIGDDISRNRALQTIKKNNEKIEIKINAKDSIALKSQINSIIKTLVVFEKAEGVKK